jgi:two-component system phosphate regulon sensor histidine kinase PhoR
VSDTIAQDVEVEEVGPLLDGVRDPLIVVSDGRVASANRAASRLLGGEIAGRLLADLLPDTAARALAEDEAAPDMLLEIGGARRRWEMRIGALSGDRRLVHLIDRTAIDAAERMRVDFVANASHELRTPIAAISGFAETLADDEAGGDPETRRHFLDIISREARRMQRLVEDLMSLSRIEADRHVKPAALVDLTAIVREAAQAAAEQRSGRGADLVVAPMDGTLIVRGDAPQLAQLAHNLVSNGFKYGRPGTPVTVSLSREGGWARLTVEDEGEGIAAHHLPRITQRFYRVDATRSRAVGGTGLGLAIVKHIVERHRGRLDIRSEVGRGTCVVVALPLDWA